MDDNHISIILICAILISLSGTVFCAYLVYNEFNTDSSTDCIRNFDVVNNYNGIIYYDNYTSTCSEKAPTGFYVPITDGIYIKNSATDSEKKWAICHENIHKEREQLYHANSTNWYSYMVEEYTVEAISLTKCW